MPATFINELTIEIKYFTQLLGCCLDLCVAYQQSKLQEIGCWCDLLFSSYPLNLNINNGAIFKKLSAYTSKS